MNRTISMWMVCVGLCWMSLFSACPEPQKPGEQGKEAVEPKVETGPQEPRSEPAPPREQVQEKSPEKAREKSPEKSNPEPVAPDEKSPADAAPEKAKEAPPKETTAERDPSRFVLHKKGGRVCRNHICIEAPAGSIPKDNAMLTIKPTQNPPKGSVLPPMDVGPDDWKPSGKLFVLFDFSVVRLPANVQPSQLRVAYLQGGKWVYVPTTIDPRTRVARGETTHLSSWALVISSQDCNTTSDCHDAELCTSTVCTHTTCANSSTCGPNQLCSDSKCVPVHCPTAKEQCGDKKDNNCNGQADEGCP